MNSSLLSSDCSERCSCSASAGLTCQAAGCLLGRVCDVQGGVRDCWVRQGLCSLSVGANLTTFDGARSAIGSSGVYEVSSRCPGLRATVPWYRVLAGVWPCHGKDKAVGQAHIFFQDGLVTVTPNNGVWVSLGTGGCLLWALFFPLQCPCLPGCLSGLLSVFVIQISAVWSLDLYLSQYLQLSPSVLAELLRSKNTLK